MSGFYGSIDLTRLGEVARKHPELVRVVNMKDGTQHKFLNIDIGMKQQKDQYGHVAYLKVSCKKAEQRQGLNYYLADLRESQNQQQPQNPTPPPAAAPQNTNDDLPF
jgi:predicted RNA-binding protein YlxR (DUF448 family)